MSGGLVSAGSDLPPGGPAWHLPGLERPGEEGPWHRGETAAGHAVRAPALEPAEARAVAGEVRRAALAARRERTVAEVARTAGEAARALADPESAAGREARERLARELSWPERLAAETLEGMAAGWAPGALMGIVRRELGDPGVLDGFVAGEAADDPDAGPAGQARRRSEPSVPAGATGPDGGPGAGAPPRRSRTAAGPPLLLQVQAGNVPGVGVTGVIRGLLARSGVLGKTSRREPGLAAAFARSLARRDPLLGRSVAVTWWPGGEAPTAARAWAKRAGKAVVYGGEEAVAGVRSLLPAGCDLVAYGPKIGAGAVLPDADLPAAARALARDVCAYEQRGCVSPRLVFTLGEGPGGGSAGGPAPAPGPGGAPGSAPAPGPADARRERFADLLAEALGDHVKDAGRAPLTPGEASAIRGLRAEVELGGGGEGARVVGPPEELGWTVLTGPRPRIEAGALPRMVRVYAAAAAGDWGRLLAPLAGRIQAVGYAGADGREALAEEAALLGACRVAPFGRVAWPPADWLHDGRHQLLPLLRWTELEESP